MRLLKQNVSGLRLLDAGSGSGEDSAVFESLGYTVESFDKKTGTDIRNFEYEVDTYDFINVNNILPFLKDKNEVKKVLLKMADALKVGGVLSFSIFGDHDEWYEKPEMSFWTFEDANNLVNSLSLKCVMRDSSEYTGKTMSGEDKYWHIHRFVLVKY